EEVRERLGEDESWCRRIPGSRLVAESLEDVWGRKELWRFGARAWAAGAGLDASRAALAHLNTAERPRVEHVLEMAAIERGRPGLDGPRAERIHPHNRPITD